MAGAVVAAGAAAAEVGAAAGGVVGFGAAAGALVAAGAGAAGLLHAALKPRPKTLTPSARSTHRRVTLVGCARSFTTHSFRNALLHRSTCNALDEVVEEEVVKNRYGDTRQ